MTKDNDWIFYLMAAGFILVIILAFIIQPVSAYDRIPQGGIVYVGETYDLSGVLAGYLYIAYINDYSNDFSVGNWSITYMINTPERKADYYNYYIDPEIFGERPGYWYRYNGEYEARANNRAFRVVLERPPANYTPNATERQELGLPKMPPPPVVPEKHVADYLVARGDTFNATFDNTTEKASVWILGRVCGIYNRETINGTAYFNRSETAGLETGSYKLLYLSPGKDGRFDFKIEGDTLRYLDEEFFTVRTVDLKPLSPMVIYDRLRWMTKFNDDNFSTYSLEVQEPRIEITTMDTIMVDEKNQSAVIQVRGYTNLANNTPIWFILDEERTPARALAQSRIQNTWYDMVKATNNSGSMRYFDYSIPVFLDQMSPGEHNVTVRGSLGAWARATYWKYYLPEGSPWQNKTRYYIGGNEFIPTPTPQVITKVETVKEIVTQIVIRQETPSDEQVFEQQRKAQYEVAGTYAMLGIIAIIGVMVIVYAYLVKRRL
jgi:hypothetical protein